MLSVNYIFTFLDDKQEKISNNFYNKINKYELENKLDIKSDKKLEKYNGSSSLRNSKKENEKNKVVA
jgi:hypothetical protein